MTDTSVAAPEPQDDSDEQKPCAWCGDTEGDVKDGWEALNGDVVFLGVEICADCFWFTERENAVDRVNRKYEKLTTASPRPAIYR